MHFSCESLAHVTSSWGNLTLTLTRKPLQREEITWCKYTKWLLQKHVDHKIILKIEFDMIKNHLDFIEYRVNILPLLFNFFVACCTQYQSNETYNIKTRDGTFAVLPINAMCSFVYITTISPDVSLHVHCTFSYTLTSPPQSGHHMLPALHWSP